MRRSLRRLDESDDHLLGVSMSFTITLVPSFPINPRTFPSPHETPRGCGCDGLVGSNPQVRVRSNSVDWLCVPSFPSRRFVFYQLVFGISRMFSSQNEYLSQFDTSLFGFVSESRTKLLFWCLARIMRYAESRFTTFTFIGVSSCLVFFSLLWHSA